MVRIRPDASSENDEGTTFPTEPQGVAAVPPGPVTIVFPALKLDGFIGSLKTTVILVFIGTFCALLVGLTYVMLGGVVVLA
jgi:hypothetical protein